MKTIFAITLLVTAYGVAGNGDYAAEQKFVAQYCDNVQRGVWQPYNPEIQCKGVGQ